MTVIHGGAESIVTIIVAPVQIGSAVIGSDGGVVQGSNGALVEVPAGALASATTVSITPMAMSTLPRSAPDSFHLNCAAFQLNVGAGGTERASV